MCSSRLGKMVRTMTGLRRDVTLRKVVSRLDLWNIVLSTVVRGIYFAEPDTVLVFKIFYGVFVGGTRLAMPKTNLRAGLIVIEAWFMGY